jgi:hypothetical protein
MTKEKRFAGKLKSCLRQTARTRQVAERGIDQIRRLLDATANPFERDFYRRQLERLEGIVRSCEREEAIIRELLHKVQNEPREGVDSHTPPHLHFPLTIRVYVPKGLQLTDEQIKELVLQKLNLNGYAKEAQA